MQKEEEDFTPPLKKSPFQAGDDQLTIAAKCQDAREKAGGDWGSPSHAGGADALADGLIAIYCQFMGEALPRGSEIVSCRAAINKVLKVKGLQQDGKIAKQGMEILLDPDGEYQWYHNKYTLSVGNKSFIQHYGKVLARLLADGTREPKVIKVRR